MELESITFTGTVMTVIATGTPSPSLYKLNDGAFQVSNEFDNVPRGINQLVIQDEVGSESEFCLLMYNLKDATESGSFTMSYSMDYSKWVSFHDYLARIYFNHKSIFSETDCKTLWKHEACDNGSYYGILYPSYVDIVFNNPASAQGFHVTNLVWSSETERNGFPLRDETITSIEMRNNFQTTGELNVKQYKGKYINGKWSIGEMRDSAKECRRPLTDDEIQGFNSLGVNLNATASNKGQIISPYVIVRFKEDNTGGYDIYLYEFGVISKEVRRL